ncbi:MAG: oligosaccharide flippase family protein, partial [Tistlia sp.]
MSSDGKGDGRFGGKTAEQQMLRGSVWMIGMRWVIRGIGLVSTLILARLLAPEDFGLVAMTLAGMQILTIVFSESGLRLALIRHRDPQRVHYDTAWTLNLIIAAGVALAIVAAAALAAD